MKFSSPTRRISKSLQIIAMVIVTTALICPYPLIAQTNGEDTRGTTTSGEDGKAGHPAENDKPSAEELERQAAWRELMLLTPKPERGCFTAAYPSTEWQEVACTSAPAIPMPPKKGPRPLVVGNGDDISPEAPSGFISMAIGSFENVTGVTSVSSLIGNTPPAVADAYSLQLNTNFFNSTACAGSPNPACTGWEQFVFFNNPNSGSSLFIQYWLLRYNDPCPTGVAWNQFSFTGSTDIYCWRNANNAVAIPNQPVGNLAQLILTGEATATTDNVTLSTGTNLYTAAGDNSVNVATGWQIAEFNVFGAGGNSAGGAEATFNAGSTIVPRTRILYGGTAAPNCVAQGFTAETNNLSFGPTAPAASAPGPAVLFTESSAGGSTSNCAAATTVGDTHLATFERLFYDFQASGDFVLARIDPDFVVQARQVSGAPTWPDASVNSAIATRMGKTEIAICLETEPARGPARLYVDGHATDLADGNVLSPEDGVDVWRRGAVYVITDQAGNSVRATAHNAWMDVSVGLGRWPSSVRGLLANANGNANQIATSDGSVLTNPFPFEELYHRYADSWRVPSNASLLAPCGATDIEIGAPDRPLFANDLEPEVREQTRDTCLEAGVRPGPLLDACTLDVAVIGNDEAAQVFVTLPEPVAVGAPVARCDCDDKRKPAYWALLVLLAGLLVWALVTRRR